MEKELVDYFNRKQNHATHLLDCSPVRYRKAFSVALKSSLIFSEDLFRKNASASSTNKSNPRREPLAQSKTEINKMFQ